MISPIKSSTSFRCFFIIKKDSKTIRYRVDSIENAAHPYQLMKRDYNELQGWKSLSVYASVRDCVGALLNDLFSPELRDEINHGQATIDSGSVLSKISAGERYIFINQTSNSSVLSIDEDIDFNDLVIRRAAG